ncbi:MFS transporter [Actinoplanes philippinensis]|uniref:Predicted arabinose efflux permease, MFS family n=1 Tax=Actinoplanes philippinensis TaxID=35752 RepID=A0A1I2K4P6_9ACTN|nr:MFS transporter [Actinoplanes philippinensis]GIE81394.1 MFS transporter [Actinoplanes philippinensis]SFF61150.1 Predicted arabinose efflux permease, MFS family [Actinoplanes philippinensis]
MSLTPYRETLALPKITSVLVVATLARIPIAAAAVVLTLHVVEGLHLTYGAAGLVGAASTIGGSFGAPVMGRLIDRWGLRPILVLTTVAEVVYWLVAQALPYWALLPVAAVGGFLALPAFSVARQAIAALTPESHRLPAFALDSMTTELSFMAGPALGVLIVTTAGSRFAMIMLAVGILLAGVGLWLLDPPVRAAHEAPVSGARVPRRSWLKPRFVAILAVTMAATLVLSGTDVAVVAVLRETGHTEWAGLVLSLWALFSLVGGFLYGMVKRGVPMLLLFAPMAVLTIPVGLGGDHWALLALLLIPAGSLCAPTITASSDAISRLIPAGARGEAMGLHNSALTVGVACGAPLAGLAIDHWGPAWGFVAVGAVGVLVALLVLPTELRHRRDTPTPPSADETASSAVASAEPSGVVPVASSASAPAQPAVAVSAAPFAADAAQPSGG